MQLFSKEDFSTSVVFIEKVSFTIIVSIYNDDFKDNLTIFY